MFTAKGQLMMTDIDRDIQAAQWKIQERCTNCGADKSNFSESWVVKPGTENEVGGAMVLVTRTSCKKCNSVLNVEKNN